MGVECRIALVVFVVACVTVLFGLGWHSDTVQYNNLMLQRCSCNTFQWLNSAKQQGRSYFTWFNVLFLQCVFIFQSISNFANYPFDTETVERLNCHPINLEYEVFLASTRNICFYQEAFLPHLPSSARSTGILTGFSGMPGFCWGTEWSCSTVYFFDYWGKGTKVTVSSGKFKNIACLFFLSSFHSECIYLMFLLQRWDTSYILTSCQKIQCSQQN